MIVWKNTVLRLAAALCLFTTARAHAEPRDAASRRAAYVEARDAIVAKNWAGAEKILAGLWAEARTYDVALGLGQAELNLKEYAHAAEHLSFALAHLPPRESDELRARAQEFLALAREHLATVTVWVEPQDSTISVDGEAMDSPSTADIFVEIGPHTIAARHAGYESAEVRVDALQGESYPVRFQLSPLPAPAAAPVAAPPVAPTAAPVAPAVSEGAKWADQPPSHASLLPVYIAAGVTAVGLGVGIGTLVAAGNKESDKDDILARLPEKPACGQGTPYVVDCGHVKDLNDQASTLRTVGFVGVGVAVAAAGTAAYFLVTHKHGTASASARSVRVWPVVAPRSVGAFLHADF
ncbi:MAG TPA: hypothetical protein VMI54_11975 [Polyangiaceae bacterium]|nr:hypothetical protein [Polyangiaceae bacterium]